MNIFQRYGHPKRRQPNRGFYLLSILVTAGIFKERWDFGIEH
jgi:hypothetical protein